MIHSDQGVLYRCGEYLKFARSHGIVRSMSGKGSCYDNAVIESHFGNLKGWLGKLDRIPADTRRGYCSSWAASLPRSTCGSM